MVDLYKRVANLFGDSIVAVGQLWLDVWVEIQIIRWPH